MKTTRTRFRAIALVLAMATVFLTSSFTAVAEDTTVNQTEPVTSSPTSDETTSSGTSETLSWTNESIYHYAINEIPDRREENVKHFYMPDGTYKAVAYADAVHRQDSTGAWKDIDNSLSLKAVSGTNKYSTSDGRVTFAPVFTYNGNVMTLTENGYSVSMAMAGSLPDHISIQNVPLTVTDAGVNRNEQLGWHSIDDAASIDTSSSVKYTNVAEKTDLEYILTGNDIKENIIIKAPQSGYEYPFILTLSGLTAVLENNGSVTLSDDETGDAVYFIPAPYMYDAAGNTSHSVSYSLLTIKDEIYALTVTADSEWINAEGRAFPVTVDPTINSTTNSIDTYISSVSPDTNFGTLEYVLLTSDETIGLFRHNIPSFPTDSVIRKVEFNVYYYFPTATEGTVEIWFSPILQSWGQTSVTWDSVNISTFLDRYYDFVDFEVSGTATYANPVLKTFDVTSIYERWLEEESSTYYGIALEQMFTDKDFRIKSRDSGTEHRAYYTYTYTDNIQDGVYSLQNMGTMTYTTVGGTSWLAGDPIEQIELNSNPAFTTHLEQEERQGLFKITNVEGTDRFVIRSMINNKHTISMTSDGMVTKEIPALDSEVPFEDTYYIEYGLDGIEFRPAGTPSQALSVDFSTLELTTVPETSIGMSESWMITQYSGNADYDIEPYMDTDRLKLGEETRITPYAWSTVPGANSVSISVSVQTPSMVDAMVSYTEGYLSVIPLKLGKVMFSSSISNTVDYYYNEINTKYILPDEGTYYLQNVGTGRYMDVEGPSTSVGANIQQWDFHTGNSEKWVLEYMTNSEGYVRFRSTHSNLYLGVNSSNTSTPQIKQYLTVSDYTLWSVQTTDSGNVKLVCKATESSGNALAVPSSANANGTDLTQVAYTDDTNYRDEWKLCECKYQFYVNHYYDQGFSALFSSVDSNAMELISSYQKAVSEKFLHLFNIQIIASYTSYTSSADRCKIQSYGSVVMSNCDKECNHYPNHLTSTALRDDLSDGSANTSVVIWTGHILTDNARSNFSPLRRSIVITPWATYDKITSGKFAEVAEENIFTLMHESSHHLWAKDHYCYNGKTENNINDGTPPCSNTYCDICVYKQPRRNCAMTWRLEYTYCSDCIARITEYLLILDQYVQ